MPSAAIRKDNLKSGPFSFPVECEPHLAILQNGLCAQNDLSVLIRHLAEGKCSILRQIIAERHIFSIVIIRALVMAADCKETVLPHEDREIQIAVLFPVPLPALEHLGVEQRDPFPVREIAFSNALVIEDRRDKDALAKHILKVQILAGTVIRICKRHRPADRRSLLMRDCRHPVDIRHQSALQLTECAHNIDRLLVKNPRNAVGVRAVKT